MLALLRATGGLFLLLFHGWGKIASAVDYVFLGEPWRFVSVVASLGFPFPGFFAVLAALAEFVGGLLLAVGLFTRPAAAAIAATMAIAAFRHLSTDMRIELPVLYLLIAAIFLVSPTNPFSLDGKLKLRAK